MIRLFMIIIISVIIIIIVVIIIVLWLFTVYNIFVDSYCIFRLKFNFFFFHLLLFALSVSSG